VGADHLKKKKSGGKGGKASRRRKGNDPFTGSEDQGGHLTHDSEGTFEASKKKRGRENIGGGDSTSEDGVKSFAARTRRNGIV